MDNDSKTIFSGTPTQAGTYKYTMTATNGTIATRSGSINVTSQGTGISENSAANNGVMVYPNPFSTDATIAINADVAANGLLTLTDMMGQTIRKEEISLHDGTNTLALGQRTFTCWRISAHPAALAPSVHPQNRGKVTMDVT